MCSPVTDVNVQALVILYIVRFTIRYETVECEKGWDAPRCIETFLIRESPINMRESHGENCPHS